jgi:radical SAM protein with 4Fe4S-binding SPASM domain
MNKALVNKVVSKVETALGCSRLHAKPVVVDVVLTKACNFACAFCKDYETEGASRISLTNFERMAAQLLPTASRMSICSGGEPYLHTGLEEILRIGRKYNPSLYTWVLSNGSIIREKRMQPILEEGLITEHGFSVDGFKAATVEGIRLNAKFNEVMENIRLVLRMRQTMRLKAPSVTIRYALMRSNIEELPDAVRMWGDLGVEKLDTGYLSLANGMDRNLSLFYHQDLASEMMDKARLIAEKYPHLTLNLPEPIAEQAKYQSAPKKCDSPWRFVMIDANGQILPCYRAFEALRFPSVYDPAVKFDEVWNSPAYQALRSTVNNDKATKHYPYCGRCEMRYGWSQERSHLGDESWIEALGDEWLTKDVQHKRPLKGTARRNA